jgi:putative transposase
MASRELLLKQIEQARLKYRFKLLAYVLMPEHVHLVMWPPDGMKMGRVIGEIKSKMAREYFALTMPSNRAKKVFWQKRCYDHNCRTSDTIREKVEYCHKNPVKRGLVAEPGEYVFSSFNWYRGEREVPLLMDEVEI